MTDDRDREKNDNRRSQEKIYILSLKVIVPSKSVKKMNLGFDFIAGS